MQSFPEPTDFDVEAVQDALAVARTQWQRGERPEALRWLRRAIDAAFEEGDDVRGLSLSKAASELQTLLSAPAPTPAVGRPSRAPPPQSVAPPPLQPPVQPPAQPPAQPSMRPPGMPRQGASQSARPPMRSSPPPPTVAPRAVRTPLPPASVLAASGPPGALRLPLPAVSTGPGRPLRAAPSAPATAPQGAAPAQGSRRNNTRANRRNTRVPVEAGRPSSPPARSVVRAETDLPTLQGERSPLADVDTTIIPMPDLAALEAAHAAQGPGERTAPFAAPVGPVAVLTQSVRVAIGPGPTVRVLPASEGLRAGECEAWLTATSPSIDLAAALRPRKR